MVILAGEKNDSEAGLFVARNNLDAACLGDSNHDKIMGGRGRFLNLVIRR